MILAALAALALAQAPDPTPGAGAGAPRGGSERTDVPVRSEATEAGGAERIERIEIDGARRTAPEAIRRWLGLAPGERFDPGAVAALERRLMNRRLFRRVAIRGEPGPNGVVLRVAVEERLTLVPIPVAFAARGVFTGGLVLLDANAFGGGESLAVGALGGSRGASGFAFYRDPGVGGSRALLAARLGAGDVRRERYDGRDRVYVYRDRYLEGALAGGWRLGERWAVLGGWSERRAESRPSPGFAGPPADGPVHGPTLEVELEAADYEGWRTRGVTAKAELRQGVRLGDRDRRPRLFTASATLGGRGLRDHSLSLTLRVDDVHGDPRLDAVRLGGLPGSRGFRSQGLWAEDALGAALEYQIPVARPRWGVVTVAAFTDAGAVRWRGEELAYVAPGVGLRVFLRNVAVPVLGFDVAWATGVEAPAFGVQLGFRR